MKLYMLLFAVVLYSQLLHAQNAIILSFSPNDDVSTCKIDARSSSTDSGAFILLLTVKEEFVKKWQGAPVLSMISPGKSTLYLEPFEDSVWMGYGRKILEYKGTFILKKSEIGFLHINRIRSITLAYPNAQTTLKLSRRSGKALMKLIGDHW
jgi:hypothetical protein